MQIGILGLPNVGKSTLFNALTAGHAASSNYPFTTIDPNIGVVHVPDPRLDRLEEIFCSEKKIPAAVRFVDVAGLVRGASQGEGLGNQFLAQLREVDALLHLVRLFRDDGVTHVMGHVDPKQDVEVVEAELILSDLSWVEKQMEKAQGKARTGDKSAMAQMEKLQSLKEGLSEGKPARQCGISMEGMRAFPLLTAKPVLYVGNTGDPPESGMREALEKVARARQAEVLLVCGKLEAELAEISPEERKEYFQGLGILQTGLERVIYAAYRILNLLSFFTVGKDEARAWTIQAGTKAPQAAGKIHTDFEKGFIRADVYRLEDLERMGSETLLRERGLIRSEGKDYVVQDGDICFFKFSS